MLVARGPSSFETLAFVEFLRMRFEAPADMRAKRRRSSNGYYRLLRMRLQ
jgi:hypothetical protein